MQKTNESTYQLVRRGSMDKPTEKMSYPTGVDRQQIQQLRVNTLPAPVSTARIPRTQNNIPSQPKAVSGVRTTAVPISGTNNVRMTISFNRDPADSAYQSANVYIKQGVGTHNQVASIPSGATQASIIVPKSPSSSVVTVQSVGTGQALPLSNSPSKIVSLK